MTTNAINCGIFNDRLMAYLEHEVDDASRAALERHALSCDDCGELLADLRKLHVDTANLAELTPSRDLWSGIAARIEAPVVSIGRMDDAAVSARTRRWGSRAAIAASLVAAAGIGYVAAIGTRSDVVAPTQLAVRPDSIVATPVVVYPESLSAPAPTRPGSESPRRDTGAPVPARPETREPTVGAAQLALATLTADYDREMVRLRALIEQRRNQLDPVTVAIIEKNLQVIDTAIAECQRAVARDPSSRFLIESLNQSLQSKVELMRTAALLPART
jgi:hypothetical protein